MTVWSGFTNHLRIGLDFWTDPIGVGTAAVNVYAKVTVQCDSSWNFADNQTVVLSGDRFANWTFYNKLQKNQSIEVGTARIDNQSLSGGGPTYNFTARLDGVYLGAGPSISASFTLPAKINPPPPPPAPAPPYVPPVAPTPVPNAPAPAPEPVVNPLPSLPVYAPSAPVVQRAPGAAWSFIAQRADTGEFLNWDLPLTLKSLEWQLSAPGSLAATLEPDDGGLRGSDGRLIMEEWGTLIYAESGGEIRWGGILIQSNFNGEAWEIEAAGFGTYLHARYFQGELSRTNYDVAEAIRAIWYDVQRFPDGDLGVKVTGPAKIGVTMGTDATPDTVPERLIASHQIVRYLQRSDNPPIFEDLTWRGCPPEVSSANDELMDAGAPTGGTREDLLAWLLKYNTDHKDDVDKGEEAKPYELNWYEAINCGEEVDDLAKTAPFDWTERHYWSPDHEEIVHEFEMAYPRLGRRRDDLSFVQGDNVSQVVTIESNGDDFANVVIGLGAGEGRSMVRRETGVRDGRLRREHILADKAVTDPTRLDALIAEELNARRAALRVESVTVEDHPNAPIGSWEIGDDVLVSADLPWVGEVEVWCRIVGWTLTSDTTATLSLIRSDLYRYGGVSPDTA